MLKIRITRMAGSRPLFDTIANPRHNIQQDFNHQPSTIRTNTAMLRLGRTLQQYSTQLNGKQQRFITTLIVGSSGCLGATIAQHLKQMDGDEPMTIIGADVAANPRDMKILDNFITLPQTNILENYVKVLHHGLDGQDKIDLILCTAGGWQPGYVPYDKPDEDACILFAKTTREMIQQNLYPVIASSSIAASKLSIGGMFVAIGAAAPLSPTPGMEGYGLSKSAVHHLIQSMGKESSIHPRKLLNQTYLGILPTIIDTPANRKNIKTDDYSSWVDPKEIALEIGNWLMKPYLRPASGNLIKVTTNKKKGKTHFVLCR